MLKRSQCRAVTKQDDIRCKNSAIPSSQYCVLHVEKSKVLIGAILGAIAGYLVSWALPSPELKELRELRRDVGPIIALAENSFPNSERSDAILSLAQEVDLLRQKLSKFEYQPLDESIRESLINELRPIADEFTLERMTIEVTYETWVAEPVRQFAGELANLLVEAGFEVGEPKFATVYLITRPVPMELGFHQEQRDEAIGLWSPLRKVIESDPEVGARDFPEKGRVRFHFGGEMEFRLDGSVIIR